MTVPVIIKSIIQHFKLNNSSFAKKIGVRSTTIDRYTNGRKESDGSVTYSKPTYDVIKEICQKFDVSSDYILGLNDDMFEKDDFVLKYIVKNHQRLIKHPVFLEYLKTQKLQLKVEKSKEDINEKMKSIEKMLMDKFDNQKDN